MSEERETAYTNGDHDWQEFDVILAVTKWHDTLVVDAPRYVQLGGYLDNGCNAEDDGFTDLPTEPGIWICHIKAGYFEEEWDFKVVSRERATDAHIGADGRVKYAEVTA